MLTGINRQHSRIRNRVWQYRECPKCGYAWGIKYGIAKGKQRFMCRKCGHQYTRGKHSRKPLAYLIGDRTKIVQVSPYSY